MQDKLFTVVGCGNSAQNWVPRGHTIACNDAWKWGKPTDILVCCNRPSNFTQQRIQTIAQSKPKEFYSNKDTWAYAFPEWKKLSPFVTWYGTLYRPHIYYSNTSPFIALSLAFHFGATKIIMYGCDFKDHHIWSEQNPETTKEVTRYMELIGEMDKQGCKVFLGNNGTAFDNLLPLWNS